MNRIFGILQIGQHARLRWTGLATGRGQALRNTVVTERALIGRIRLRVEKAAAVGASLNAVAAPDAIFLIDQNHSVRRFECRSNRAGLHARRIGAVVAKFRNEEALQSRGWRFPWREAMDAPGGRIHGGMLHVLAVDFVALDPVRKNPKRCPERCPRVDESAGVAGDLVLLPVAIAPKQVERCCNDDRGDRTTSAPTFSVITPSKSFKAARRVR